MTTERHNWSPDIKRSLTNVRQLCDALGLTAGGPNVFARQAGGLIVRCPVHEENTPSCSIQLRDGLILWHCHGCDASGDAISLVTAARGMSMRGPGFRDVLIESARIAGLWSAVSALESGVDAADGPSLSRTAPRTNPDPVEATRTYPDDAGAFWGSLDALETEELACGYLCSRGISHERADAAGVLRVIPSGMQLPQWARYRGRTWIETGHRLVVPVYDAGGTIRSVRGWRIIDGDSPKRLPPGGHKASELVMADEWALAWLRGQRRPERVVISEGEPDFTVWATRLNDPNTAIIGIVAGSWHAALANRFPIGCRVDVRTDHDQAGDRYFAEIESSLRRRCFIYRSKMEAA